MHSTIEFSYRDFQVINQNHIQIYFFLKDNVVKISSLTLV